MKAYVESTDQITEKRTDSRGWVTLGSEFANTEVQLAVLETLNMYKIRGEHLHVGIPWLACNRHHPGDSIDRLLRLAGECSTPSDERLIFVPPIGGHFTMDRHEAAMFARNVDPDLVLPVHYDTFDPIETDAAACADKLENEEIRVELF